MRIFIVFKQIFVLKDIIKLFSKSVFRNILKTDSKVVVFLCIQIVVDEADVGKLFFIFHISSFNQVVRL